MTNEITLTKVEGTEQQVNDLYNLLKNRSFNISHKSTPSYDEHYEFVMKNPYIAWYLIYENFKCIGSCYVMDSNCISVSLIDGSEKFLSTVLDFIIQNHSPLKEIKSVRPPNFYINIPTNNALMKEQVAKLGWTEIQTTFSLT